MDVLVELKALTDALTNEVTDLEKRRTEVSTSFVKLKARQKFLTDAVTTLEKDYADGKAVADANLANLKVNQDKEIELINSKVGEAQSKLAEVNTAIKRAESQLDMQKESAQTTLNTLVAEQKVRTTELTQLDTTIANYEADVTALEESKRHLVAKIDELQAAARAKEQESSSQLARLDADIAESTAKKRKIVAELDDKYDELESLKSELVAANELIASANQRELDAKEYEKRAIKALEAREEAILNKESELAVTTRRRGILDNL